MKNFSRKEFRNFRIGYTDKNATNTNMPAETWQPQYRACCLSSVREVIQKLQQSGRPRGDMLALGAYMSCMQVIVPYAGHSSA
jgi:hypothetical protein